MAAGKSYLTVAKLLVIQGLLLGGVHCTGNFVNVTGNILLGAMFPLHSAAPGHNCSAGMGPIDQAGIQNLEALLFSLKRVNEEILNDTDLQLGVLAFDTCYSEMVALESALQLVRLQHSFVDSNSYVCPGNGGPPRPQNAGKIIGVIGAATSGVSIQLASFLRLFQIPQISYSATSPELSDTSRYDYFLRTVPSDKYQAEAIVGILKELSWRYVTVVYEDTSYGKLGIKEIEALTADNDICVARAVAVKRYYMTEKEKETELRTAVQEIIKYNNTEGQLIVILFLSKDLAEGIFLQAAQEKLQDDTIIWLGTDAWAGRPVATGVQKIARNALGVQPLIHPVEDFDKYFKSLSLKKHKAVNPWFLEYWEEQFNCSFSLARRTKSLIPCYGNETFSSKDGTYNRYLNTYSVMDAVYAFALAARALYHEYNCTDITCDELQKVNGTKILAHLKNVEFIDPAGLNFRFRNNSGTPRYSLLRHVFAGGRYSWEPVGTFAFNETRREPEINWYNLTSLRAEYRPSVCSEPCGRAQARSVTNKCCWTCVQCQEFQYVAAKTGTVGQALVSELCLDCSLGEKPNWNQTECDVIEETTMDFSEPWAIISIVLSCLGLIMTVVIGVVFYMNKETPIIMASGKELSFVLLVGILMSYVSSFVFVAHPNVFSCGATRLMLGLSYTICYAAILVKTNRIYRVFNIKTKKPKKVKFIDAKSQLLITFIIVLVEIASLMTWIVFDPPEVINLYPSKSENVRVCDDSEGFAYLGALVYPFFLMILCVVYAIKTRKTPDGFNETRYITFGSYSFCIMWIAFISIYFTVTNNTIRIVALCFASTVNATVTLITLFMTKANVALFQPEKNTKENVMSRRRTHSYETVEIGQMSNLSRMVSAVSTWHSVYAGSGDSQLSSIQHKPPPKNHLGGNLSISVVSVNNDRQSNGSVASIPSAFTPSKQRIMDSDVLGLSYRASSEDCIFTNTLKFEDIVNNHVITRSREDLDESDVPKLHQRRSLRSMKSRRRRRRSGGRPRSAEIPPSSVPSIVVTAPSDKMLSHKL